MSAGWLLELAAASRSVGAGVPARRRSLLSGRSASRAASRARRQLVRQEIVAKVAPPVEELPAPEPPLPAPPKVEPVVVRQCEPIAVVAEAGAVPELHPLPSTLVLRVAATPVAFTPAAELAGEEPEASPALVEADSPVEEQEEVLQPLLQRIGAYTAKPSRFNVH